MQQKPYASILFLKRSNVEIRRKREYDSFGENASYWDIMNNDTKLNSYPSIFNHALAPITAGPSSSNTSGPYRIGSLARQILGGIPKKVKMDLATSTNYASTFMGSLSDLALINGLIGKTSDDPEFLCAYVEAKKAGMEISFDVTSWAGLGTLKGHRIYLTDQQELMIMIIADSTGGGTVKVMEIDGNPVDILGDHYELLIFTKSMPKAQLEALANIIKKDIQALNEIYCTEGTGQTSLIEIKSGKPVSKDLIKRLEYQDLIVRIRTLNPVHTVVTNNSLIPPFDSPEEMIAYASNHKIDLWQAAVKYEAALSDWTEDQVFNYGRKLWGIIKVSIEKGMSGDFDMNGIVTQKAGRLAKNFGKTGRLLPMGILDLTVPISLSIMEYSNASGIIVCIPTGGASGIVPGCIYGAGIHLNLDEDEMVKALMVAGILGVFMSKGNNFCGGEFGCQAEVGCGAAMASGALVHIMGGNPKQICDAASMSLQCLLGLVCDPVAGVVQIPCLARNMGCTAIAVVSANAIMAGFDVGIPFSEMFEALKTVGEIVSRSHEIGSATTPTGCRMREEQTLRDKKLRPDDKD